MIEILPQSTTDCLAVYFSGKATGQEYQQFLDAPGQRLNSSGKVSLVLKLSGFEGYGDLEAVKKDFKFGFGEYKSIHRAAFVSDKKWVKWITRLMDPFTRAEEKYFPEDQIESALTWACS